MPNLFDGYCYPTIQDVRDAVLSHPSYNVSAPEGLAFIRSTTVGVGAPPNPSSVTYQLYYKTGTAGAPVVSSAFSVSYPYCAVVGKLNPSYSLPVSDAIILSWGIIAPCTLR